MQASWLGPLFPAALPFATALPAVADQPVSYQALLTPLLKAGTDIVGQPLAYPEGAPVITAAIVTLPPGRETGWHVHEVPLFVHILEGAITLDYGEKGTKVYAAGDSLMEAMNWPHNGTNKGTVPVSMIAVYMGGGGKADAKPAPAPQ